MARETVAPIRVKMAGAQAFWTCTLHRGAFNLGQSTPACGYAPCVEDAAAAGMAHLRRFHGSEELPVTRPSLHVVAA